MSFTDLKSIAEYRVAQRLPGPSWLSTGLAKLIVGGGLVYARLRYGFNLREASPLAAIRQQTTTPVLLIHGLADTATPSSHSERLAAAAKAASLWLVAGAHHTSGSATHPQEFRSGVLAWFAAH